MLTSRSKQDWQEREQTIAATGSRREPLPKRASAVPTPRSGRLWAVCCSESAWGMPVLPNCAALDRVRWERRSRPPGRGRCAWAVRTSFINAEPQIWNVGGEQYPGGNRAGRTAGRSANALPACITPKWSQLPPRLDRETRSRTLGKRYDLVVP